MDLSELKIALQSPLSSSLVLPVHVLASCAFFSPWQRECIQDVTIVETYQDIAALGYLLAIKKGDPDKFSVGVEQLSGRTYFINGRALRFEIDPIALLGVALGYLSTKATNETVNWFIRLLDKSIKMLANDPWEKSLVIAAKAVISNTSDLRECDPILSVSLRAALGKECPKQDRGLAWKALVLNIGSQDPLLRAAQQGVFHVCAAALARLPIHGSGVKELIEILEGVSQSMSHWSYETKQRVKNVTPQQWEVDHEYHVQNLLWTVLRPVFPDLVDEESLPKLGHTSPRYDLGIPSLFTIIEVKYMRKKGQSALKKITDEIAADRSLYLRENAGFTSMIVFIWDECRQTEEYKTLCDGLESLSGIERVIVLPRPARMDRLRI